MHDDGVTYRTPTSIWSVAVEGALYVRVAAPRKGLMRWRRRAR